jgi:hypothetical protein
MYIRQAKQFLRNVDSSFDERKFGFGSLVDLMRACQREGLFRIERDRQGVMRIFPGNVMQPTAEPVIDSTPSDEDFRGNVAEPEDRAAEWTGPQDPAAEPEVVEGDVVQEIEAPPPVIDVEQAGASAAAGPAPRRPRSRSRARTPGEGRAPRKAQEGTAAPRARKSTSRPRTTRARTRSKDAQPEE